jgi:Flp pilus assembly protein TadD
MKFCPTLSRPTLRWLVTLALGAVCVGPLWAQDANLVMVIGRTEVSPSAQGPWVAAEVQQKLGTGSYIRTLGGSQVALLLSDQTQVRLNQNSVLQITDMPGGEQPTTLSLLKGRIWAQVKQLTTGSLRAISGLVRQQQVRVNTPTATVGIRGTDWELTVGDADTTTLTVFSGEVEISNSLGLISVGANEHGVVEAGKAPVKSLLTNARDRVQWVTAYRPTPQRWLPNAGPAFDAVLRSVVGGDYARALADIERLPLSRERALLSADMALFMGRADAAIAALEPWSRQGAGDPMASALLARALLVAGRIEDAAALLQAAHQAYPADPEVVLALGDAARLQGDASAALAWFTQATLNDPQSAEAWFGVGRVQTEKEDVRAATDALDRAIQLAPQAPGYHGERATLLAMTGSTSAARAAFADALQRQPDDYLAWTGLGILQLKTGETRQALDSFLKAGVIEPRFARAQLYVGVAYYQLGNQQRAVESVRKAAELDAKDPLPYVMLGLMQGDNQELANAVDSARQAQERMPYLKSLNQLLNNQKGSANVGSALAARGMEEWAQNYAASSYNPHWAGSALFLADRYPDGFNKNSELYRGFLLDPTAFGASNRFSSLVASPGHYGRVGLRLERADFDQASVQAAINGLSTERIPFAYTLITEGASGQTVPAAFSGDGGNVTLGLGAKPSHDLNLFYFGTRTTLNGRFNEQAPGSGAALSDAPLEVRISRQDIGMGYQLAPGNRVLLKVGSGSQRTGLGGVFFSPGQSAELDDTFASIPTLLPFSPKGFLDHYGVNIDQTDWQVSQVMDLSPALRATWGAEHGTEQRALNFVRTFQSAFSPLLPILLQDDAQRTLESTDLYLSVRANPSDALAWQGDLAYQELTGSTRWRQQLDLVGQSKLADLETPQNVQEQSVNPRLGLRLTSTDGQQLRLVAQQWRRPVGLAGLAPVDTLGVPVEDRLVEPGGLLRRVRAQYDWQLGSEGFMQTFVDYRQVRNLSSPTKRLFALFGVTELASLRAKKPVFGQAFDDLEATPAFDEGDVSSVGVGGNWLLSRDWSLAARYRLTASRNTTAAFSGLKVPYMPEHFGNASLFWQGPQRWLIALNATYRSARFSDEANLVPIRAGVVLGLTGYWESLDKRWTVGAGLANLQVEGGASTESRARASLEANYNF